MSVTYCFNPLSRNIFLYYFVEDGKVISLNGYNSVQIINNNTGGVYVSMIRRTAENPFGQMLKNILSCFSLTGVQLRF